MIEDLLGEATWPVAFVAVVLALVLAHGMHEDRANRQQLRLAVVRECVHAEVPADCGAAVKQAIKAAS